MAIITNKFTVERALYGLVMIKWLIGAYIENRDEPKLRVYLRSCFMAATGTKCWEITHSDDG